MSGTEILSKEGTGSARAQALMISSCVDSFGIVGLAQRRITRQADSAALPPGTRRRGRPATLAEFCQCRP